MYPNHSPRGVPHEVTHLRNVFVIAHSALFLLALSLYLASHGGMDGDYKYVGPGNDVITGLPNDY